LNAHVQNRAKTGFSDSYDAVWCSGSVSRYKAGKATLRRPFIECSWKRSDSGGRLLYSTSFESKIKSNKNVERVPFANSTAQKGGGRGQGCANHGVFT